MDNPRIERRTFLLGLAASVFSKTIAAGDTEHPIDKEIAKGPSGSRAAFVNDEASTRIGFEYLSKFPEEANLDFLKSATIGNLIDCQILPSASRGRPNLQTAAVESFQRRHEADCNMLNMVCVKGLVLSRTEARLYGLIALYADA